LSALTRDRGEERVLEAVLGVATGAFRQVIGDSGSPLGRELAVEIVP